ncbi:MAG: intracellular septation protein [Gammaproteobacteria bacterium]|jgi:intracellular septation protein
MKILIDFFPVVAFFVAYYIPDDLEQRMYIATIAAIIATIIQVTVNWLLHKRFEKMHVITLILILVLGGLTLVLQDKRIFMWKPTAVNWLFAIAFIVSEFIGSKPLIQRMMDHAMNLPENIWYRLNRSWTLFFIFSGALNLYVAFNFAENIWVDFKLFGILGLTLLFAIGQALYLAKHVIEPEQNKEEL